MDKNRKKGKQSSDKIEKGKQFNSWWESSYNLSHPDLRCMQTTAMVCRAQKVVLLLVKG